MQLIAAAQLHQTRLSLRSRNRAGSELVVSRLYRRSHRTREWHLLEISNKLEFDTVLRKGSKSRMDRPIFHFRQAQAAFDLIWLLREQDHDLLVCIGGRDFPGIVGEQSCRFESQADATCFETLASTIFDASDGAEIAVAMIVANDLQSGLWNGDSRDFADVASDQIRTASHALRSALLRALDVVETAANRPTELFLPNESRLTRGADQILPELCKIARSMDASTRKSVAAADYGDGAERHLEALNDVLSRETCLFPKNQAWYPSEVVELVSHVRETPGFIPCTALLLANALQGRDNQGWFDFRWANLAADYNDLCDSVRTPILAGLRFLYEAEAGFTPYFGAGNCDPVQSPKGIIDFVRLSGDPI